MYFCQVKVVIAYKADARAMLGVFFHDPCIVTPDCVRAKFQAGKNEQRWYAVVKYFKLLNFFECYCAVVFFLIKIFQWR